MRVSAWWVPCVSLGVILVAAAYRAVVLKNYLVATDDNVGIFEHWLGLFRNTLSESLVATLDGAKRRATEGVSTGNPCSLSTKAGASAKVEKYVFGEGKSSMGVEISECEPLPNRTVLVISPAIRRGMRTWSGTEDVMKVGLEMAKSICSKRMINLKSEPLQSSTSRWLRVVRMRLAIYVPGLEWESQQEFDFVLPKEFDFESLIRIVLKILHVCMDHEGQVTMHSVNTQTSTALSHVLCGLIAESPIDKDFDCQSPTLRQVLFALKDNKANTSTSKISLEQAILLPTIILASTYNRWLRGAGISGDEIQALQDKHVDRLALSGKLFLDTIMGEFHKLGIWDKFMTKVQKEDEKRETLLPRDASSGNYTIF